MRARLPDVQLAMITSLPPHLQTARLEMDKAWEEFHELLDQVFDAGGVTGQMLVDAAAHARQVELEYKRLYMEFYQTETRSTNETDYRI